MTKPTIAEVLPLVESLYSEHPAGCCLHIVLDDGNVRDSDVDFCRQWAIDHKHEDCEKLALKLRSMSRTQRAKLYKLARSF